MPTGNAIVRFSMFISKASLDKKTQKMLWRSVNSDTEADLYEESMSLELFKDFTDRIDNNLEVPENFKSVICEDEEWCGGMPYLSVAHYRSGVGKKNIPGLVDSVYVDGTKLKSRGTLHDSDLGRATFKSLCSDLYGEKSKDAPEPIRISIAFLDLQHRHVAKNGGQEFVFTRTDLDQKCQLCSSGIGGKIYTKGQLVHLAMTRVPVNPRTEMEVERSMDIITKKDDAESIIGELADGLEEKSQASDVLVVKADGVTEVGTAPVANQGAYPDCYDPNTDSYDQECINKHNAGKMPAMREDMSAVKSDVVEDKSAHPTPAVTGDPADPETWQIEMKDPSGNVIKYQVSKKADTEEIMEKIEETPAPVVESKAQTAFEKYEAKKADLLAKGVTGDAALKELQPFFNDLGKSVTEEFSVPGQQSNSEVMEAIGALGEQVRQLSVTVATIVGASGAQTPANTRPAPRSLVIDKSQQPVTRERSQIEKLSRQSVGLAD